MINHPQLKTSEGIREQLKQTEIRVTFMWEERMNSSGGLTAWTKPRKGNKKRTQIL